MTQNSPSYSQLLFTLFLFTLFLFSTKSLAQEVELSPPIFSHPGGFYSDTFELTLSHPDENVIIYYTLDGSEPGQDALTWENSITITNRSSEDNILSMIPTNNIDTGWRGWSEPNGLVRKATVVRARAYFDGESSAIVTHTYFVFGSDTNLFEVPVLAINTNSEYLFDDEIGIYVPGDNYRPGNHGTGNYYQSDNEWEKPASFEFFETDGSLAMNQTVGLRIHGGYSRRFAQKSLRLYARSEYGENRFNHQVFPDLDYDSYNRLLLRNSGNDFGFTMMMDATAQALVTHFSFDTQAYRPSIVFINGEYWGIHNIRERYDKHYLERVYNIDPDNIDLLENRFRIKEGSNSHYVQMRNFIIDEDLSIPENFAHVQTLMDVENYLDYYTAQVYYGNNDWPHNNIDYWRLRVPYNPDAPLGHDGRWRWLLFDVDRSLGYSTGPNFDMIHWITAELSPRLEDKWPNEKFRNLLENPIFYNAFVNRIADHLNTSFLPDRVISVIDEHFSVIRPLIEEHVDRYPNNFRGLDRWLSRIELMRTYANERPFYLRQHMMTHLDIGEEVEITLDVNELSEGFVQINTTDINDLTVGIHESVYPWSGIYFSNIPIRLTAKPKEGYQFSHWETTDDTISEEMLTQPSITFLPKDQTVFTAHFEEYFTTIENVPVHYWIFTDDLPNNIALTSIAPLATSVGGGLLTYHSAVYPYPPEHGNNGIMDRVNDPTEVNFVPRLLHHLSFQDVEMRGIRTRNPARIDDREASIVLQTPTIGYEDINLSFAARRTSNGQQFLRVAYAIDCISWTTEGIVDLHEIFEVYRVFRIDFSEISEVNNNPNFCIRITFDGDESVLLSNSGNVRFNNILLSGLRDYSEPQLPVNEFFLENFDTLPPPGWQMRSGKLAENTALTHPIGDVWLSSHFLNNPAKGEAASLRLHKTNDLWFITPSIDMGAFTDNAFLKFDLGIADILHTNYRSLGEHDYFALLVSLDNGETWSSEHILFELDGSQNATIRDGGETIFVPLEDIDGVVKFGFYVRSEAVIGSDLIVYLANVGIHKRISTELTQSGWNVMALPADNIRIRELAAHTLVQGIPGADHFYGTSGLDEKSPSILIYQGQQNSNRTVSHSFIAPENFSSRLRLGQGFLWYLPDEENSFVTPPPFHFSVAGMTQQEDVTLELNPNSALTLLGNPFNFPISAATVSGPIQHALQTWNGHYFSPASVIEPFQGFFVEKQEDGNVVINSSTRNTSPAVSKILFKLTGEHHRGAIVKDHATRVSFLADASHDWDNFDLRKIKSLNHSSVNLSIIGFQEDELVLKVIDSHPFLTEELEITMSLDVSNFEGEFELGADLVGIPEYWQIKLRDNVTSEVINLREENHFFTYRAQKEHSFGEASQIPQVELPSIPLKKGRFTVTINPVVTSVDTESDLPTTFALYQNFPNPFNPTTNIRYDLPEQSDVRLDVYNIMGQHIATLINSSQNAGAYNVIFDASQLASGIYFYRLQTGSRVFTKKMLLLK